MLTLYAFGPGANSLKPLFALHEKGLPFEYHLLDAGNFEHHADWFKAINPRGQVPALDHDGKIVTESTVICEYLEQVFPDKPLMPADAFGRAEVRIWTKWVDEYFCWCVSTLGWERIIRKMTENLTDEEFEEKLKHVPVPEQKVKWRTARKGFPREVLDEELRKVQVSVRRLEDRLKDHDWLAGDSFTLADICNFAIANGLGNTYSDFVNEKDTPGLLAWTRRINERPAVKEMYENARKVAEAKKAKEAA